MKSLRGCFGQGFEEVEVGKWEVVNSTLCLAKGVCGPTTKNFNFFALLRPYTVEPRVHNSEDYTTPWS